MHSGNSASQQINRSIYLDDEGIRLMRPEYFTAGVRRFHDLEKLFYLDLLGDEKYSLIIEVGCSSYRLIGVKPPCCDYLGVDINPPKERRLPQKRGAVIQCEANRFFNKNAFLNRVAQKYSGRVLCILPFNFLGTMDSPLQFLKNVCQAPFDLALSVFGTEEIATDARLEYYRLCGIEVQNISQTHQFVRLDCTNSFKAFAFEPEFLKAVIQADGYRVREFEYHDICNFIHFEKCHIEKGNSDDLDTL